MKDKELAKWMHDNYEAIAKNKNWNTQENCKVEFEDLPDSNKDVMLELARRLLNLDLLDEHFKIENKSVYYTKLILYLIEKFQTPKGNRIIELLLEFKESILNPIVESKSNDWISINDEKPDYYDWVEIKLKTGKISRAWRASTGDYEVYTLEDNIEVVFLDDIDKWRILKHE